RVADRGNAPAPAPVPGAAAPTSASQVPPARSELRAAGDREVLHALSRLAYGPRPGEVERVRALGHDVWLERQLHPEKIDDSATEAALAELATLRMTTTELLHAYPRPDPQLRAKLASGEMSRQEMQERYPMEKRPARITAELQAAKMVRAVTSERQLQEVMVDFWFNHFNAFAGWTIERPQAEGRFVFRASMHDTGEKTVLGRRIPAGGGREDGERVIEILTRHPSTARFIATKLVRRFVSDVPPPALVDRVA